MPCNQPRCCTLPALRVTNIARNAAAVACTGGERVNGRHKAGVRAYVRPARHRGGRGSAPRLQCDMVHVLVYGRRPEASSFGKWLSFVALESARQDCFGHSSECSGRAQRSALDHFPRLQCPSATPRTVKACWTPAAKSASGKAANVGELNGWKSSFEVAWRFWKCRRRHRTKLEVRVAAVT